MTRSMRESDFPSARLDIDLHTRGMDILTPAGFLTPPQVLNVKYSIYCNSCMHVIFVKNIAKDPYCVYPSGINRWICMLERCQMQHMGQHMSSNYSQVFF